MRRVTPVLLMLWPLVMAAPSCLAQQVTVEHVDVIDAGTYRITAGAGTAEPGTPTGEVTAVDKSTLLEATNTLPAKSGTEFGLRYIVVGKPAAAEVDLDIAITYPAEGLTDPATGRTIHESRYTSTKKIGASEYLGYGIEHDWEAVPGAWTFEIWHGGKRLAYRTFTLTQ